MRRRYGLAMEARRVSLVRLSSELARSLAGIGKVAVDGEVHKPSTGQRAGGRTWFTLRDRASQITVTVPASRAKRARVVAGERVQVTGSLEWVHAWGALQLVADEVVPVGEGAVAAMIAEARSRLAAEGLLDRPRRPLPLLPRVIGVVCGNDAAVRHDIESVVAARFPGYPTIFREVSVSGPGAVDAVCAAIDDLGQRDGVDVIVLARGGGDTTQLLPFSDEELCRAVVASRVPVVSAIGHERDRPLCDDVADLRCGTPSLAASAVVPDRDALVDRVDGALARAAVAIGRRAELAARRLTAVDRDRAVLAGLERARARLDRANDRLPLVGPARALPSARARLDAHRRQLDALSPQRVLERGYAVVRLRDDGAVVRDTSSVKAGMLVDVQVATGSFAAEVTDD
jgi:exodeoxyribonuclease VII large subunit